MLTKKAIIELMKKQIVVRHIDKWKSNKELKREIIILLEFHKIPATELAETPDQFTCRDMFWFKERREERTEGEILFQSKSYKFIDGWGEIPKADQFFSNDINMGFFILDYKGSKIFYTLDRRA